MQAVKKGDGSTQAVSHWSPEPAKLNSMFSRVARRSLPSAPASRTFSQDTLRRWEKAFREQSVMCNHAAGLSRCLTKVQDSMVTQLKSLRSDSSKGKSAERMQQAVEELEYLVTFNRSFYCVNTSYAMDNMLNRSAQTGPPNVRKRRPVFPPAGRSIVLCTPHGASYFLPV